MDLAVCLAVAVGRIGDSRYFVWVASTSRSASAGCFGLPGLDTGYIVVVSPILIVSVTLVFAVWMAGMSANLLTNS